MLKQSFLFAIIISILSCTENKNVPNTYIIPEEKMIEILKDFHITDAASKQGVISNNRNNYIRNQQYLSILSKHEIEKARFDSTIIYYSERPEDFKKLYDRLENEMIQLIDGH